ncbi:hypothetical protein GCM10010191_48970 [Actinomadura vinacea]|uniref:Uncharacterized protein n=1 Tax=Actinomadura vinacea TaxID=115336 RepID=A0ABN3JGH9_9ACTN
MVRPHSPEPLWLEVSAILALLMAPLVALIALMLMERLESTMLPPRTRHRRPR